MQLADDDTFGTVNDKSTVFSHQRNFTEIDFLFLDVPNGLSTGLFVDIPSYEAYLDLDRRSKGHSALVAFFHVILRSTEFVGYILHRAGITEITNRKYRPKDTFQTARFTFGKRHIRLQKAFIRCFLDIDQVWNINDIRNLCEVLPEEPDYSQTNTPCFLLWVRIFGPYALADTTLVRQLVTINS